jgi:Protein of unknown function (DUF2971)
MERLNSYTTLPVLLDMLMRKRLVLLDPALWEDKNDSEILLEYKKRKRATKFFALCFSYGDETIHHWRTFANGISGCCIEFDKKKLISLLKTIHGIRYGRVIYRKFKDLKDATIDVMDMSFTKRWPYRCEEEFRIIWTGRTQQDTYEIPFDLSMIIKVTINQGMPKQVYDTIRDYLLQAFKHPEQRINRSTLYENRVWINKFKRA